MPLLWNNESTMIALLMACGIAGAGAPGDGVPAVTGVHTVHARQAVAAAAGSAPAASPAAYYEFLMGLHHESAGAFEEAVAAYRRAATLDPSSSQIPAVLATLLARMNRPQDAIAAADMALRANSENADAHLVLGKVYASMVQADDRAPNAPMLQRAIAHLERAALQDDPGAELILARLYLRAGSADKAIPILTALVEREPQYTETLGLLVQAYASTGRETEAITLLEGMAADHPQFYRVLAELYERSGRWDAAAGAYEQASAASPRSVELRIRWATALLNSPRDQGVARAREVLEGVVRDRPGETRGLYLLSLADLRLDDLAAAEATARRLVQAEPAGFWGPYALAQVYEERNEYAKVVETLEPVVEQVRRTAGSRVQQDGARVLLHLGFAYQQTGNAAKAVAALEEADRLSPDASTAFQIGATYERQKRYAEAERSFLLALNRDPDHAPTLNYLGYMLAERGERLAESVRYIERALAVEPDNPSYLDSLGWVYFKLDDLGRAEPPLRRASQALPRNSVVQDHWGDLLFKLGRYAEAIAAWEQSLAGDGESIERATIETKIRAARGRAK
jgi:tetratricopeptide (TPR) repeat protein